MTDATELDEAGIRARWTRPKRDDYQGPGADIAHSMAVLQWSISRGKEAVTDVPLLLAALDEARAELTAARERAGRFAHDANLADDRCDRLEALANKHYARAEKAEGEQAYTYGIARKAHARAEAAESALAAVEALADETEAWEWTAPVGPGNASYANGYENGRRSVATDLRAALAAPTTPDTTTTQGEAMTTTFADRRNSDHDCTTDTHCCSDCQTHDGCSCKRPTTPEETQP